MGMYDRLTVCSGCFRVGGKDCICCFRRPAAAYPAADSPSRRVRSGLRKTKYDLLKTGGRYDET